MKSKRYRFTGIEVREEEERGVLFRTRYENARQYEGNSEVVNMSIGRKVDVAMPKLQLVVWFDSIHFMLSNAII